MFGTGAEAAQRLAVGGSRITFMLGEAVGRITVVQFTQFGIAGGFSQDRGGADRRNRGVALDDRLTGTGETSGNVFTVHQRLFRRDGQGFNGAAHGQQ